MSIKFIDQIDIKHKRVFIRVDFNVPLKGGDIQNDARIKAALPTIEYAIKEEAKIILAAHLGRPKGKIVARLSLRPIAERLQFYLKKPIIFSENCEATGNIKMAADLEPGGIMLLENLRFHPGETKNSEHFANKLSKLCDVYIDDAFGVVHRAHASVALLPTLVQERGGGFLVQKETKALSHLLSEPKQTFTVVLVGGQRSQIKLI